MHDHLCAFVSQAANGGTFTQNPMSHTFCIIARTVDTVKVAVQRAAQKKDIIHYSWLQDSVANGSLLPLSKKYVVSGTARTLDALDREVDEFGDFYATPADAPSLARAIKEAETRFAHPFDGGMRLGAASSSSGPQSAAARASAAAIKSELPHDSAIVHALSELRITPPTGYRSQFHSFDAEEQEVSTCRVWQ
jgi:hypothetical protein